MTVRINHHMKWLTFSFFACLGLSLPVNALAERVYVTSWKSGADKKVYVTNWREEANMVVYKTSVTSEAAQPGVWFFAGYPADGVMKIYFTQWKDEADLKIYYTINTEEAGPRAEP